MCHAHTTRPLGMLDGCIMHTQPHPLGVLDGCVMHTQPAHWACWMDVSCTHNPPTGHVGWMYHAHTTPPTGRVGWMCHAHTTRPLGMLDGCVMHTQPAHWACWMD